MEKGLMQNKTFLKVISLVIAVIIWSYVITTQDPQRTNRIDDVQIICGLSQNQLNEGLSIISKSDETVSFHATGKRSLVTGRGSYYANLDLNDISQPGRYTVTPEITKPAGVTIENVRPATVEIFVDRFVSSLVPVNIKTENTLPDDYILKQITGSIEQTAITAPSLELEKVAYVGITVDLSRIKESKVIECVPDVYDINGEKVEAEGLHIDTDAIKVTVDVQKVKKVKVKPNFSDKDKLKGYTTSVTPEYVKISGETEDVKDIDSVETELITLKKLEKTNEFETKLVLPAGVKLMDENDEVVKVTVRKEEN